MALILSIVSRLPARNRPAIRPDTPNMRYVRAIDRAITSASQYADEHAGAEPKNARFHPDASWAAEWNRLFHAAMDRKAFARGLRRQSYQNAIGIVR